MAVTQYIGARYVPLFADPLEWANTNTYEPLTIVQHEGNSYTSRQYVPKGIDISNEDYWALTGNYNAQIEQYRTEVQAFDQRITTAQDAATSAQSAAGTAQGAAEAAQAAADSKAPISHASAETTYGAGTSTLYGHVKISDDLSESAADSGIAASPKMVNDVNSALTESIEGKATISHASANTTYGAGTSALYGHVKISDTLSESAADSGIAASPKMVNDVNDALSSSIDTKTDGIKIANILRATAGTNIKPIASSIGTVTLKKPIGLALFSLRFTTNATIPARQTLFTIDASPSAAKDISRSLHFVSDGVEYVQNLLITTDGEVQSYSQIASGMNCWIEKTVDISTWGGDFAPVDSTGAN